MRHQAQQSQPAATRASKQTINVPACTTEVAHVCLKGTKFNKETVAKGSFLVTVIALPRDTEVACEDCGASWKRAR